MSEEQRPYQEVVKHFHELSIEEVEERLQKGEKTILYIGKPTCPYCQRFVPKLNHVREQNQLTVYYLNSLDTPTNPAIQALRNRMEIPTVPQVVTIDGEDSFTNLHIESSVSEEELTRLLVK